MLWLLFLLAGTVGGAQAVGGESPGTARPVIALEHDGRDLDGFIVYLSREGDAAMRRIDIGLPERDDAGLYVFELPVPDLGLWTVEVAAYNAIGESARIRSDPPQFRVRNPDRDDLLPPDRSGSADGSPEAAHQEDDREGGALRRFWRLLVGDDSAPASPDRR